MGMGLKDASQFFRTICTMNEPTSLSHPTPKARGKKPPKQALFVGALAAVVVIILVGTTMPSACRDFLLGTTQTQIEKACPFIGGLVHDHLAKLGHFGLFALFGWLLTNHFRWPILALLAIVVLAGSTELLQGYIPDRTPLVRDFCLDAAGGTLGVTIRLALPISRIACFG